MANPTSNPTAAATFVTFADITAQAQSFAALPAGARAAMAAWDSAPEAMGYEGILASGATAADMLALAAWLDSFAALASNPTSGMAPWVGAVAIDTAAEIRYAASNAANSAAVAHAMGSLARVRALG